MQSICLADGEGVSQGFRSPFSIPEGSWGARKGPQKKFGKSEVATKMATSSHPRISTVCRGRVEEGRKVFQKVVVKLTTFFKKAVCKIEVDRRLELLNFEG